MSSAEEDPIRKEVHPEPSEVLQETKLKSEGEQVQSHPSLSSMKHFGLEIHICHG